MNERIEAIKVDGKLYPLGETVRRAPLGDLYTLKVKSQALGSGVSPSTLREMFDRINETRRIYLDALQAWRDEPERAEYFERLEAWDKDPEKDPGAEPQPPTEDFWESAPPQPGLDLLDDERNLINLIGLIFLAHRSEDRTYTWEQAQKRPFESITLGHWMGEDDRDDQDDSADPDEEEDEDPKADVGE